MGLPKDIPFECFDCKAKPDFAVGVTKYNWQNRKHITGFSCSYHSTLAVYSISASCQGTYMWPIVADLKGRTIFNGYRDGELQLLIVPDAWLLYLLELGIKDYMPLKEIDERWKTPNQKSS